MKKTKIVSITLFSTLLFLGCSSIEKPKPKTFKDGEKVFAEDFNKTFTYVKAYNQKETDKLVSKSEIGNIIKEMYSAGSISKKEKLRTNFHIYAKEVEKRTKMFSRFLDAKKTKVIDCQLTDWKDYIKIPKDKAIMLPRYDSSETIYSRGCLNYDSDDESHKRALETPFIIIEDGKEDELIFIFFDIGTVRDNFFAKYLPISHVILPLAIIDSFLEEKYFLKKKSYIRDIRAFKVKWGKNSMMDIKFDRDLGYDNDGDVETNWYPEKFKFYVEFDK